MKKILLMSLSLVLVAVLAIGGTFAYLTDQDEAVNVMTLGKVEIAQHEYQRATNDDGSYKTDTIDERTSYVLEGFKQNKPLLPAVIPNGGTVDGVTWDYDAIPVRMSQVGSHGGANVFNTPNAQDKFVTVENTGKTDAYVRTLIALEVGTATIEDPNYPNQPLISSEIRAAIHADGAQPWTYGYSDYVEINGNNYLVYELVYTGAMTSSGWKHEKGVLPAGETTYPNLCQVYMASRATNEDVEAIDGNNNGTYDILVLSQAVQADGFDKAQLALDTAFGKAEDKVVEWFGGISNQSGVPVDSQAELMEALDNGDDVFLIEDIELPEAPIDITGDVTIDLNGFELDASANTSRPFNVADGGSLTINAEGTEIDCGTYGLVNMTEGTLTINGGTFTNEEGNNGAFIKVSGDEEMVINLNNVTYKAGTTDSGVLRTSGDNVTVNIKGGEYEAGMGFIFEKGSITDAKISASNTANMWPAVYADGDVTVTGCEIKSACHAIAVGGGNTVTVENCNVTVPAGKLAFQVFSSGGTINVNDCTWTGNYGTTGKMNTGCVAVINIDGVEKYRKN